MRKRLTKVGDAQAVLLSEETLELLSVRDKREAEMRAAAAFSAVLAEDEEVLERLANA